MAEDQNFEAIRAAANRYVTVRQYDETIDLEGHAFGVDLPTADPLEVVAIFVDLCVVLEDDEG